MWKSLEKLRKWNDNRREVYLGYTVLYFTNAEGKETNKCTVHFFARSGNLDSKRRVTRTPRHFAAEEHGYWRDLVMPWLYGENLWSPIQYPSLWLIDYTEKKGFTHKGKGHWLAIPPKTIKEGNVITFTPKGA